MHTQPDSYATLTVGGNTQKTHTLASDSHPMWEEGFSFMVFNPMVDYLIIKVI